MNMQSTFNRVAFEHGSLGCAHDLLVAALQIVDDLSLPGDIGAHLDHALNQLRKAGGLEMIEVGPPPV